MLHNVIVTLVLLLMQNVVAAVAPFDFGECVAAVAPFDVGEFVVAVAPFAVVVVVFVHKLRSHPTKKVVHQIECSLHYWENKFMPLFIVKWPLFLNS